MKKRDIYGVEIDDYSDEQWLALGLTQQPPLPAEMQNQPTSIDCLANTLRLSGII